MKEHHGEQECDPNLTPAGAVLFELLGSLIHGCQQKGPFTSELIACLRGWPGNITYQSKVAQRFSTAHANDDHPLPPVSTLFNNLFRCPSPTVLTPLSYLTFNSSTPHHTNTHTHRSSRLWMCSISVGLKSIFPEYAESTVCVCQGEKRSVTFFGKWIDMHHVRSTPGYLNMLKGHCTLCICYRA